VSVESLEQVVPPGDRLLLDASTLIAYLNGGEPVTAVARYVVEEMVRTGRNIAMVSAVTAMEILVRPLQAGAPGSQHVYDFLQHWPNLRVIPIDLPVALQGANLRAFFNFRAPDALVAGTGLAHQLGHLVTNDDKWKRIRGPAISVCYLGDHVPFP
jgi:predicted nucleic acid-binding protein